MHTDPSGRTQQRPTSGGPRPPGRDPVGPGAGSSDPLVGLLLDRRYRVRRQVARGGMASVYEATDIRLDRTVAVKVMHASMGGPAGEPDEFAQRFVREARAAARLSHPNVVAVFDQGEDDGVVYLAMELVPGHTLRDTIAREGPLPAARALALLEPVLSALASAHRAGLVHRDVKPENVLISTDGRVKVADFGLARAVSSETQHTATQGVLIGTVSYLAPELVLEGRADARADVYAAGVMLYELLTATKPHAGETPIQVAYKHVHADVPPPSLLVPGLPAYVDALVARATARDVAQRPADASVLLHQLHRVSQALAEGVRDDVELTEDLTPVSSLPSTFARTAPAPRAGTAPEIVAPAEVDRLLEGVPVDPPVAREQTTAWAEPRPGRTAPPSRRPGPSTRRRRGPVVLALGLVVALVAAGGAYWLGWARYTATPGVIGLSAQRADARLTSQGLELDVAEKEWSETVPAGRVVRTDPTAGSRVLPGGTVSAVVSLGQERYDVPRLAGRSVDEAQDALLALRLTQDEAVERYSETVPEGTVIRSRPGPGTTLRPGSPVELVVSQGRRPIKVGRWVGKDYDTAVDRLTTRGLSPVTASQEYDDTVPEGDVISQDPAEGTLFRGDTVSFVVSQGPELVEVPSVLAYGVDAATQALEEAGFTVEVDQDDEYVGLGFVIGTDPGRGEMVPAGSTIRLRIV